MDKVNMKEIVQLGIVVDNAQRAMEDFCQMFQVPEEYTMLLHLKEGVNGCRFTADFAWINYCGIQFEFIQPISGDLENYQEYLKQTGGGVHHIAFTHDDPVTLLKEFRTSGAVEVTPGSDNGRLQDPAVGYFDYHENMGLRFEVSAKNLDVITKMSFAQMKQKMGG